MNHANANRRGIPRDTKPTEHDDHNNSVYPDTQPANLRFFPQTIAQHDFSTTLQTADLPEFIQELECQEQEFLSTLSPDDRQAWHNGESPAPARWQWLVPLGYLALYSGLIWLVVALAGGGR
jgi:hypothetical protein